MRATCCRPAHARQGRRPGVPTKMGRRPHRAPLRGTRPFRFSQLCFVGPLPNSRPLHEDFSSYEHPSLDYTLARRAPQPRPRCIMTPATPGLGERAGLALAVETSVGRWGLALRSDAPPARSISTSRAAPRRRHVSAAPRSNVSARVLSASVKGELGGPQSSSRVVGAPATRVGKRFSSARTRERRSERLGRFRDRFARAFQRTRSHHDLDSLEGRYRRRESSFARLWAAPRGPRGADS